MDSYLSLLNKLAKNSFNQREINYLVENSVKIAIHYVVNESKRIKKIIISEDIQTEDIAVESVAPLFEKDTTGIFYRLRDAFLKWDPPIKSEPEAFYFLNKIIANRVDQQISYMLRNTDPVFSKILDSITYYLKKDGFYKINYLGRLYISESKTYNDRRKIITDSDFELIPFFMFENNKSVISSLFNYIKKETEFFPAIPLNAMVQRLKVIHNSDEKVLNQTAQFNSKLETAELVKLGLKKASEKLNISYLNKGKLNQKEATAFQNALNLMSEDLCNGGMSPGLYKYLSSFISELSVNEYKSKYHHILEYLLKVMKSSIVKNL